MKAPLKRCALYTRKSSEEGLDQDFNSLDAQREACEAYAKSQAGEGWRGIRDRYDDGGFSGGSMERPALKRLLADIEAGKIDVVVVYKIDRLTRSLADFARMVELFERHGVSFVSVTQSFNTTTSMGRLTLNVLLSFAQFEREVTGERIRDKIAASKAKGMWMGGTLPLGYDLPGEGSRALVVNETEAAVIRDIFNGYLQLQSVHALQQHLHDKGVISKRHVTAKGRVLGGKPFSRGALFHLLRNPLYRGMIVHRGKSHPGLHQPITDAETFDAVQQRLNDQARRQRSQRDGVANAPLTGRIFDAGDHPMCPSFSHGRGGKLYRYYVSAPLQQGAKLSSGTIRRLSAPLLEEQLTSVVSRVVGKRPVKPLELLDRVEVHNDAVHLLLSRTHLAGMTDRLLGEEQAMPDAADATKLRLVVPVANQRGRSAIVSAGDPGGTRPDAALIKALREAHKMTEVDPEGLVMISASPNSHYRRRLIRLAFLAPKLQQAILEGRQPQGLRLEHLMRGEFPLSWREQQVMFGPGASG